MRMDVVSGHETEIIARFRKIREGLKGASVRISSGPYKGRLGKITGTITSPEAEVEANIRLDLQDKPYGARPRLRLGITKFEVV